MSFEVYNEIFSSDKDIVLRYGELKEFLFECKKEDIINKSHRLFFKGETSLFYLWKSEPDCGGQYLNIEDSLDNKNACEVPYCLNLSTRKLVEYKKIAYKKIIWPPKLSYLDLHSYTDFWTGGVFVKTKNLNITSDGYVRMRFELRYKRDGVTVRNVAFEPDKVYSFEIQEGTSDWTEYGVQLNLPSDSMASVCCYIEAVGYSGEIYLERPFLTSENGYNVLPDFAPCYPKHDSWFWIGVNLSKKEWPEFEVCLNGNEIFNGAIFERCHRYSECECNIPDDLLIEGKNKLTIKLISSYPNPLPYKLKEVGCFVSGREVLNIISCPKTANINKTVKLLLKTIKPNTMVKLECENGILKGAEQIFENPGLNVFEVQILNVGSNVKFTLSSDDYTVDGVIERIVNKIDDNIYTGSGDMIYINHESIEEITEYLSWYTSNQIGNLLTIRPVYRWGGGRKINENEWKYLISLLNKLDIKYSHMIDGRDMPGVLCNPPQEMIKGKGFLGRQGHEYDGQYLYWGVREFTNNKVQEANNDLCVRLISKNEEIASNRLSEKNYVTEGEKMFIYRSHGNTDDMEVASNIFVERIKDCMYDQTRHTGPSTTFKYFFQAGYKWVGAELMYGPTEIVIASLRGASYCYGQDSMGGHLAVQWSTTPHDSITRYRRFRIALYVSYIQGITEINTEEGFWHLEEYYTSFSRQSFACRNHLKQQQDFYNYVNSHSRTGNFYTSFAFLSGRYDGWRSFGSDMIWGITAFESAEPEKSWELLRLFYPLTPSENVLYCHPCPDEEVGFHTGTPRGNVDIVPIECELNKLCKYKTLSFAGYNKMCDDVCKKLIEYVKQGGTLIIGWPHLSVTTNRNDIIKNNHKYNKNQFVNLLCKDINSFEKSKINGEETRVCTAMKTDECDIVIKTDNNLPLVIKKSIDRGTLWFVNSTDYPANKAIKSIYEELIISISEINNEKEQCFVSCNNDVQFSIYTQDDGSKHIYLLAVDWYNTSNESRKAELIFNGNRYSVSVPFGVLIKVVVNNDIAAWVESELGEVIDCGTSGVCIQGYGRQKAFIIRDNKMECHDIEFNKNTIVKL